MAALAQGREQHRRAGKHEGTHRGSGDGAFGGRGVSAGRIVSGVSIFGLDGSADFRCNWSHGFPFLNRSFFPGRRPAGTAAARNLASRPEKASAPGLGF
ncbi:MAG: hypothetical protein R6V76_02775, partial [Desulfobacterales bacterium]